MRIPHSITQNWPFSILSTASKDLLCQQVGTKKTYTKTDIIETHTSLFFLIKGSIGIYEPELDGLSFRHQINTGCVFGLRESILQLTKKYTMIAQTNVELVVLPSDIIQILAQIEPQFSLALSRSLRQKSNLFGNIKTFISQIQYAKQEGIVNIEQLLPHYKKMAPALHPFAQNAQIDFGAWSYARNRLPQDLLQTHVYLLATEIPRPLAPISTTLDGVETRYRRRVIKKLSPGKSIVLVRDMHTDLIDFVSNLCVHAIEARKLRKKLHAHNILGKLNLPKAELESFLYRTLKEDWTHYKQLWPSNTIASLKNLMVHHEDYFLCIEKNENTHFNDSTDRWISIIQTTCTQIGIDMESVEVDIISSNRFAIEQCLCPHIHQHAHEIRTWGIEHCPTIHEGLFEQPHDYVYAILPHYLQAHPKKKQLFSQSFKGFYNCNDTSATGIPVDIIHPASLNRTHIDPSLILTPKANHIIINIDYAFGKQAEDILCALISLFHKHIRSINVMGKAGALVGNRGDILLATQVVLAQREVAYPMRSSRIDASNPYLKNIHTGAVLTVEGTLLQNRPLLHYFINLWGCVGLEMEGSFYARQIQQALHRKSLSQPLETNFLYFVSDLPMQEGAQLSKDMAPHESVPPLFGIIRAFMNNIFSRETS